MPCYYSSDYYGGGGSGSSTTSTAIWPTWVVQATASYTASTVSTATIWNEWNSCYAQSTNQSAQIYGQLNHQQLGQQVAQNRSAAQVEELRRQMARQQEQNEIAFATLRKQRESAEARARELLERCLSLEEKARLRQHGHIVVCGAKNRYRIRQGRVGNVDVVGKNGIITGRLCAHPSAPTPDFDTMLAQKLMIETDEAAFLRIANPHAFNRDQVLEAIQ